VILVDTSIWIDHLHKSDPELVRLLDDSAVLSHPIVIGELALGRINDRSQVLEALAGLSTLPTASHSELLQFVEVNRLFGTGLSLVDAHLLASTLLVPGTLLWTRDKRLRSEADKLSVGWTTPRGA